MHQVDPRRHLITRAAYNAGVDMYTEEKVKRLN